MERTRQAYIPVVLFAIVLVLFALRIASHLLKEETAAGGASEALVRWVPLGEAQALAAKSGKPILYDFTAEWCAPCHLLDEQVFRNAAIAAKINQRFIAVRVTDRQQEEGRNTPPVAALQSRFGINGFPTVVIASADGRERARMEGFQGPEEFERVMEQAR